MGFNDGFFLGALTTMLIFMASVAVYNNNRREEKAHKAPRVAPAVVRPKINPWDLSV